MTMTRAEYRAAIMSLLEDFNQTGLPSGKAVEWVRQNRGELLCKLIKSEEAEIAREIAIDNRSGAA